jgi:hypothetical protein
MPCILVDGRASAKQPAETIRSWRFPIAAVALRRVGFGVLPARVVRPTMTTTTVTSTQAVGHRTAVPHREPATSTSEQSRQISCRHSACGSANGHSEWKLRRLGVGHPGIRNVEVKRPRSSAVPIRGAALGCGQRSWLARTQLAGMFPRSTIRHGPSSVTGQAEPRGRERGSARTGSANKGWPVHPLGAALGESGAGRKSILP